MKHDKHQVIIYMLFDPVGQWYHRLAVKVVLVMMLPMLMANNRTPTSSRNVAEEMCSEGWLCSIVGYIHIWLRAKIQYGSHSYGLY